LHKIELKNHNDSIEICFKGNLTIQNNNLLIEAFHKCLLQNPPGIAINCRFLDSIDSSGLGAFISMSKAAKKTDTKLFICELNHTMLALFDMSNLDSFFDITTISEFKETALL